MGKHLRLRFFRREFIPSLRSGQALSTAEGRLQNDTSWFTDPVTANSTPLQRPQTMADRLKILLVDDDRDSLQLLGQILRQVREQQLPCEVIMLTGFPAVDSAIRALREGAVDYLTKPVTREVLLGAITRVQERLLEARQRREALTMLETGLKR